MILLYFSSSTSSCLIFVFRFDLEMEFKALSKKISSARLGAKVKCEFIKEGKVEYVDWCKNKQWRLCNLTNRFNFFGCPFRLKMTSKYIKIDQSSWSLIFLSSHVRVLWSEKSDCISCSQNEIICFQGWSFHVLYILFVIFYLELAWKFVHSTLASDQVSAGSPLVGLAFLACLTLVLQYLPFQGSVLNILLQKNIFEKYNRQMFRV